MKTKTYAVISECEMYNGNPECSLLAVGLPLEQMEQIAREYNPDFDPSVGCCRLGHNQASAATARVVEIAMTSDTCPTDDWSLLPDVAVAALVAKNAEICEENGAAPDDDCTEIMEDTSGAFDDALVSAGYALLCPPPDWKTDDNFLGYIQDYYLVRL
jgi:hypothetical protein